MEPRPRGIEPQDNQVEETAKVELALHRLFGRAAMATTPGATVATLIDNAANEVPLTPEWEAFRDGALGSG